MIATVFRSGLQPEAVEEYNVWAMRMSELAKSMPGYVELRDHQLTLRPREGHDLRVESSDWPFGRAAGGSIRRICGRTANAYICRQEYAFHTRKSPAFAGLSFADHPTAVGARAAALAATVLIAPTARWRGAVAFRLRLVNCDVTALHVGSVKAFDRRIGLRVIGHVNKGEAFGFTGELIGDQVDLRNFAKAREGLAQIAVCDAIGKVAYVNIHL